MTHFTYYELLTLVLGWLFVTIVTALLYLLLREGRRRRYDEEKKRAELDVIRKSLEEQIYRLTDRLTYSDQRWKDVNHLILAGQRADVASATERAPSLDFLSKSGVNLNDVAIDRRLVFVLTPFHPEFDELYSSIKSACQEVNLTCLRGDEEHVAGNILGHILTLIVKARLVIAVVDGRNPNVFYELGIAHALSKPVLMLSKSNENVPFDVSTNRILFYTSPGELRARLGKELVKVLVSQD